jgi:hemerythrin superfamily protein
MSSAKHELDAITLLKADHRKVEELFDKFQGARGSERKKALAMEICTELSVHATIEEETFYPACKGQVAEEDKLDEAYVEHDGAKVLIAEIAGSDADAEFYDAKVKVLSELIKHHFKEEEARSEGLFAMAREAGLDIEALGEDIRQRKEQLLSQIQAKGLPTPKTRTYTGHKLQQGKPEEAVKHAA